MGAQTTSEKAANMAEISSGHLWLGSWEWPWTWLLKLEQSRCKNVARNQPTEWHHTRWRHLPNPKHVYTLLLWMVLAWILCFWTVGEDNHTAPLCSSCPNVSYPIEWVTELKIAAITSPCSFVHSIGLWEIFQQSAVSPETDLWSKCHPNEECFE